MNSLYGAMASPFFRFFDTRMAEGITLSGQLAVRWVAADINKFLNRACGTDNVDYVIYCDTDSVYASLENVLNKFCSHTGTPERIQYMLKFCNGPLQQVVDKSCGELADYMNAHKQALNMKTEKICDVGLWVAKKRYALHVHNSEGVQYKEPKIAVTGLELVRSSTPGAVRTTLEKGVREVLLGSESSVQKFVADYWDEYRKLSVEDISYPRSVNGLRHYSGSPIYAKGCPINVRAALLYNHYIKKMGLEGKYELIPEGGKIKYVYLKMPNPFRENVIGYADVLPPEFGLHKYVDYELQYDKSFKEAMRTLLAPIKWEIEHRATLEDLFG